MHVQWLSDVTYFPAETRLTQSEALLLVGPENDPRRRNFILYGGYVQLLWIY